MAESESPVALVLAGGGARGAYEAGALSVLLPVLEQRGQRPRIVLGTSAGALNASFLAANAQLPAGELMARALEVWRSIRWGEVAEPLLSGVSLRRAGAYLGEVLGLPRAQLTSLLDPRPLAATLTKRIDFDQLERNIRSGALDAAGVAATSALTGRSVVFHRGLASPPRDRRRGIDYVETRLGTEHVLASAAIPSLFPSVHVEHPPAARGWYFDGGTRLDTPVKPAIEFGAARVVVVALNSLADGPARLAGGTRPDALTGAGQILLALLQDQLVGDVQTLATINGLTRATRIVPGRKRRVPYIVIAPAQRDSISTRALRVFRRHYATALEAARAPDIALLGRLLVAGADTQHAELLSFLLFAPEFADALIELGKEDAQRWIDGPHDLDDLWQLAPV